MNKINLVLLPSSHKSVLLSNSGSNINSQLKLQLNDLIETTNIKLELSINNYLDISKDIHISMIPNQNFKWYIK